MIRYDQQDPTDDRRQTIQVTIDLDVPAQRDWLAVKWGGWSGHDPDTGDPIGEPPVSFRDDLADEIRRAIDAALPVGLYVDGVRLHDFSPPRKPCEAYLTLAESGEEPF